MIDTLIMVASVNGGGTVLKNYPVNQFITFPCKCKRAVSLVPRLLVGTRLYGSLVLMFCTLMMIAVQLSKRLIF